MSEFYVGYLPKAPPGIARRICGTALLLLLVAVASALVFATVQRTYAPSAFEFGRARSFAGTIEAHPYPALLVARPGADAKGTAYSRYLLVAEGKHGADGEVSAYSGKAVRLKGTLIYRGSHTMLEVAAGSIRPDAAPAASSMPTEDLGDFSLKGEIVDSKCYFGVMNPGSGKVHLDCAVRCLSGGIPPAFVVADLRGRPAVLLLTGPQRAALPRAWHLHLAGRPVQIAGRVRKSGETLFFEVDPAAKRPG